MVDDRLLKKFIKYQIHNQSKPNTVLRDAKFISADDPDFDL